VSIHESAERGRFAPFPADEYHRRVQRIRNEMSVHGMDAVLLTAKENVVYFSGIQTIGWESKHRPLGLLIPADQQPVLIIAESLESVAGESSWISDVRLWGGVRVPGVPSDPIVAIWQTLEDLELASARIGLELGYGTRVGMSQADFDALRSQLPAMRAVDAAEALWKVRMIKSPAEVECIRRACSATSHAFRAALSSAHEGMTERQLAGIMFREMAISDYRPGFVMVRSGQLKYRMINVEAFMKPLERGDLVIVDAGATYRDYWTDFMRMGCVGEPTAEQRRFFDCELAAQQAGVDVIRPGIPLKEIFQACFGVIQEWGLAFHAPIERVGHGVGMDMHEPPSIARRSDAVVEEGMVLTVEPIFTDQPDGIIGNFALEDVVLVTATGHEVLSTFPKDLWIIS
jgi:Xaa-Pro aminopeptidase